MFKEKNLSLSFSQEAALVNISVHCKYLFISGFLNKLNIKRIMLKWTGAQSLPLVVAAASNEPLGCLWPAQAQLPSDAWLQPVSGAVRGGKERSQACPPLLCRAHMQLLGLACHLGGKP